MRKIIIFLIITATALSLFAATLAAETLPDGSEIPHEVIELRDLLKVSLVFPTLFFRYEPEKLTAKELIRHENYSLVIYNFMDKFSEEWKEELALYEKTLIMYKFTYHVYPTDAYYVPVSVIESKFKQMFGEYVPVPKKDFAPQYGDGITRFERVEHNGEPYFLYYFVNIDVGGGGDSGRRQYRNIYDYEYTEDSLLIYENYCTYGRAHNPETGKTLYGTYRLYATTTGNVKIKNVSVEEFTHRDVYDPQYYAQYMHTFKKNEDGGYYWYSTKMIGIGGNPVKNADTSDASAAYYLLAIASTITAAIIIVNLSKSRKVYYQ